MEKIPPQNNNFEKIPKPVLGLILGYLHGWHLRSVCRRFRDVYKHRFDFIDYKKICKYGPPTVFKLYSTQYLIKGSLKALNIIIFNEREELLEELDDLTPIGSDASWIYFATACKYGKHQIAFKYWDTVTNTVIENICRSGNMELFKKISYIDLNKYFFDICIGGNIEIVNIAINSGVVHFNDGLFGASINGHLEIVKLMIAKGADKFKAALRYALENARANIIKYLYQMGVKFKIHHVTSIFRSGDLELIEKILDMLNPYIEYKINKAKNAAGIIKLLSKHPNLNIDISDLVTHSNDLDLIIKHNYNIRVVLEKACKKKNIEIINHLIKHNYVTIENAITVAKNKHAHSVIWKLKNK